MSLDYGSVPKRSPRIRLPVYHRQDKATDVDQLRSVSSELVEFVLLDATSDCRSAFSKASWARCSVLLCPALDWPERSRSRPFFLNENVKIGEHCRWQRLRPKQLMDYPVRLQR